MLELVDKGFKTASECIYIILKKIFNTKNERKPCFEE